MPTITITERQQAITAARKSDDWSVEFDNQIWEENAWTGEGDWRKADVVIFIAGGVIRDVVQAEFDPQTGEIVEAKKARAQVKLGRGGAQYHIESIETTTDWYTFAGWIQARA